MRERLERERKIRARLLTLADEEDEEIAALPEPDPFSDKAIDDLAKRTRKKWPN
mgnify:CR=1 FL=1